MVMRMMKMNKVLVITKARSRLRRKLRKRLIMRRTKMLQVEMVLVQVKMMILPRKKRKAKKKKIQRRKIQETLMLMQREVDGHMNQRKLLHLVVLVKVLVDMVWLKDLNVKVKKDLKDHQVEVEVLKDLVDTEWLIDQLVFRHHSPSLASTPSWSITTK